MFDGYETGYLIDYLMAFICLSKFILRTIFVSYVSHFAYLNVFAFFLTFIDWFEQSDIESSESDSTFEVL